MPFQHRRSCQADHSQNGCHESIKIEMNNEWKSSLGIQHTYSCDFTLVKALMKLFFLCGMKVFSRIILMSSTFSNFLEMNFQFRKQEKVAYNRLALRIKYWNLRKTNLFFKGGGD